MSRFKNLICRKSKKSHCSTYRVFDWRIRGTIPCPTEIVYNDSSFFVDFCSAHAMGRKVFVVVRRTGFFLRKKRFTYFAAYGIWNGCKMSWQKVIKIHGNAPAQDVMSLF